MMKTILKSFFVLLGMLMSQVAWAALEYEAPVVYDFATAAKTAGSTIKMSSIKYPTLGDVAKYGGTMIYGDNTTDISKFAFRYVQNDQGWYLRDNSSSSTNQNQYGLFCQYGTSSQSFAICDLHAGDIVTISFTGDLRYESGAPGFNTNTSDARLYWDKTLKTNVDYTITQDGDMIIKPYSKFTYIYTITIKTLKTKATYSINTDENPSNNTRSTTFAFTNEGRFEDNIVEVPFMKVQFGSELNGVMVENTDAGYASYIPDLAGYSQLWFENGLPYQGTFYKFTPSARGKLQMNGYLSGGTIYLYEENNGTLIQKGSATGSGTVTLPSAWATLEKGKTYYVCDDPNNRSYNNFRLHGFTYTNEFNIMELGKVLDNGASEGVLASVRGASKLDKFTIKKASGNINTENVDVTFSGDNNGGTISISGIAYNDQNADKAGVIVLDLEFDGGDATFVVTIPYSAEKGHTWDFSKTNTLEIGKYSDNTSTLYEETNEGKWSFTHRVINQSGQGTHDPMYKNTRNMAGNNAAMIWETEGLWFDTPSNKSCIYNERTGTESFTVTLTDARGNVRKDDQGNDITETRLYDPDRYVGILPGGEFSIPGLKAGDRVIIYMGSGEGSGNDVCIFNISNAKDAIGQPIDPDDQYKAGGSLWNVDNKSYNGHNDPNYRGCYHFIAQQDGPMTFKMVGGSMTKIYTIEIHQGNHKWTDDATRVVRSYNDESYNANAYQLLNTYQTTDNTVAKAAFQLHYRGKGESMRTPTVVYQAGNITVNTTGQSPNLVYAHQGNEHNIFYKSVNGEAGLFRMRIECMEMGGNYVTDYGLQNVSVGYLDKQDYPCTWDFTDLMKYAYTDNSYRIPAALSSANGYNEATEFQNNAIANTKAIDQWKYYNEVTGDYAKPAGYGLQIRNSTVNGELAFTSGSQLFAGTEFFAETAGLGFIPNVSTERENGNLLICNDGLVLFDTGSYSWRVKIPEVPSTAAVYVRAKVIPGRGGLQAKVGNLSTDFPYRVEPSTGEYVYAVKGTGGDMTLYLKNMIVQKIAVATDAKTVNKLGWNTESRDHAIDPSLLPYMTGKDFRTYIVTGVSEENKTATLARIDGGSGDDLKNTKGKLFVPAATNGSINACIIRNADGEAVDLFGTNSGFHLFVPDMHDDATAKNTSLAGNLLKARVTATSDNDNVPRTENGNNNYAFTFKYKKVDENGNAYTEAQEGVQAFYRIVSGGAKSGGNQAYLSIPQVIASSRAAVRAEEAAATPESYTLVFKDWYDLEGEKGDVNGDGLVNEADMELAKDYVTVRKSNGLFKRMGDMNDDGNVDIVDLTLLIKKIMSE